MMIINRARLPLFAAAALLIATLRSDAEIRVVVERIPPDDAEADFHFTTVPAPSERDAGTGAQFKILDGEADANSRGLAALHDGRLPRGEDEPGSNFFFRPGTDGGRLLLDLGRLVDVKQVNTYSWHPNTRGPQVFRLFASDGSPANFAPEPRRPRDPGQCGWKLIADVDTRPEQGEPGGQYGVNISDAQGNLGKFRYLLFDVFRTENKDPFGNTFFSEIDVVDAQAPAVTGAEAVRAATRPERETVETEGFVLRIDTSDTPNLTAWAHNTLAPMVKEWYPKLVKLLPSDGFEAPKKVNITFDKDMRGVAATSGARVRCAARWFQDNLGGEAVGSLLHELVHVVQQYGHAPPRGPEARRAPGWLVEGIADYVRWFKFEPQSHGAEITRRGLARARYDSSYRITANFLNWASETYDPDLVPHLNAALRQGKYRDALWLERTGQSLEDLGSTWHAALEKRLGDSGQGQ